MYNIIKDCIYGFIKIPELCLNFINVTEFQRLRNIKQLGAVYFIYPSAVHTRFEHSIGVMHLCGKLIDVLIYNNVKVSNRDKELVQLAGLYHDIGHIAFSHMIDVMLENNGYDNHEVRSCKLLEIVNNRLGLLSKDEVKKVQDIILGDFSNKSNKFLYQVVHNNVCGIDMDRLDYLQRDSYHTGLPGFQPDYLINCVRVKDDTLSFLEKGREEIYLMFQTRRRFLVSVCRHKSVLMVEREIKSVISKLNIIKEWDKIDWVNFDDIELLYKLKRFPDIYKKICERNWDKTEIKNRFKNCTIINNYDIEKEIEKVNFV